MNAPHPHAVCAWTGVTPEEDREITCSRPAQYVLEQPSGHVAYACGEHLGEIRARFPDATVTHSALHRADEGHLRVSPESAVGWE
jgi:hypothetical protein